MRQRSSADNAAALDEIILTLFRTAPDIKEADTVITVKQAGGALGPLDKIARSMSAGAFLILLGEASELESASNSVSSFLAGAFEVSKAVERLDVQLVQMDVGVLVLSKTRQNQGSSTVTVNRTLLGPLFLDREICLDDADQREDKVETQLLERIRVSLRIRAPEPEVV